jgi:hypothetical protein
VLKEYLPNHTILFSYLTSYNSFLHACFSSLDLNDRGKFIVRDHVTLPSRVPCLPSYKY